jgi:pseudouridine kinase
MKHIPDILCIGAAHLDIIGHSPAQIGVGDDVPGQIDQSPGGVAFNIARTLAQHGHRPALIAAIGQDAPGTALVAAIKAAAIDTRFLVMQDGAHTDSYLAIEGAQGLFAAIASAAALEALDLSCLAPLQDGRLATPASPWRGPVVVDSGLSDQLLHALALAPELRRADLRLAAASPAKAARLRPFLARPRCTVYLNLAEASGLCDTPFTDSASAARALLHLGATRALVTDGPRSVTDADASAELTLSPPATMARRATGAGDCFMGAHIAQELGGAARRAALEFALSAAAAHVAQPPNQR